jgi:hypothetical protein
MRSKESMWRSPMTPVTNPTAEVDRRGSHTSSTPLGAPAFQLLRYTGASCTRISNERVGEGGLGTHHNTHTNCLNNKGRRDGGGGGQGGR